MMLRIFDRAVDIGEKLKEAGVTEIKVLNDRYVLYGKDTEILDVIVDGACKIIHAFLMIKDKNQVGKTFIVDNVLEEAYRARAEEVDNTIIMIKASVIQCVDEANQQKVLSVLDRELRKRL